MVAYYCFTNFGLLPHEYNELPYKEKEMVKTFAVMDMKQRKSEAEWLRR